MYILFKDGILPADAQKLLAHAQLTPQDGDVIRNLALLGARTARTLKEQRPTAQPLFSKKQTPPASSEEYSLSRFEPLLKALLEAHLTSSVDLETFPSTKPLALDSTEMTRAEISQTSLRSAKPTWARSKTTALEPRQRVIVFMAGGATYSESRACYEISRMTSKDVFLVTSHMLTPNLFIRQVGDLSIDKRKLGIPAEQPRPQAPKHLFEQQAKPPGPPPLMHLPVPQHQEQQASAQPPTQQMQNMKVAGDSTDPSRTTANGLSHRAEEQKGKLIKEKDSKKKKKLGGLFSSKK